MNAETPTVEPRTLCAGCDCELTPEITSVEHEDVHRCSTCHDEVFADCEDCGETVERTELATAMHTPRREIQVCQYCLNDDYTTCSNCSERVHDDMTRSVGRQTVCDDCYDNNYFTCDSCGDSLNNDYYGSDGCCQNCERNDEDNDEGGLPDNDEGGLPDNDKKPSLVPLGTGPHYYGVELEVECSDDACGKAEQVTDELGSFAICKKDGSLQHGFEICTRPASLELQRKNWSKLFSAKIGGLKSFNTTTCGLHVHCSRKPLTGLTIGRMLLFVNTRKHQRFIELIAGRPFGHWATYKDKGLKDGLKKPEERYEALNLMNRDTVEFRIFKGTLKEASVYKAIEFCDALIQFCQPWTDAELPGMDEWLSMERLLPSFVEFVEKRRKQWPHLWGFISAKWVGKGCKEQLACGYVITKPVTSEQ